jgi:hypothetical protein
MAHFSARPARLVLIGIAAVIIAFAASLVGTTAASADGYVSVDQYIAQTQGTEVGDGQCAILVEDYLSKVYGVHAVTGESDGGAYGFVSGNPGGNTLANAGFSWSTSNSDLQNGDLLVWNGTASDSLGHVALWYDNAVYDANSLWQNRHTTSGGGVATPVDAALESSASTHDLLVNAGSGNYLTYAGRWRKTAPAGSSAGSAPNPAGSATAPNTFPTLGAANIRTGASLSASVIEQVGSGTNLTIDCYVDGDVAGGTAIWDHIPALSGYISDSLLRTGSNSAVVPVCASSGTSGQLTFGNAAVYRLSTQYQSGTYGTLIETLGNNTSISIDCWVDGNGVTAQTSGGSSYTDYVWYHIPSLPGWISDASVRTTSDNATVGQFGSQCPADTIQGPFPVIGSTTVYTDTNTGDIAATTLAGGSHVSIDCTVSGAQSVTNPTTSQTSSLWDHVTGIGYVPDVYVLTGVNSSVAPACNVTTIAPDATAVAGSTPTISGTVKVGDTVSAKAGAWTTAGVTLTYAWTAIGLDKVLGTSKSLTVPASAAGRPLSLTVTGSVSTFAPTSLSSDTTTVVGKTLRTATPTISGTAKNGKTLTIHKGSWTSGTKFAYQWDLAGVAISGATKSTYKVVAADEGQKITVELTGSKSGYTTKTKTSKTKTIAE